MLKDIIRNSLTEEGNSIMTQQVCREKSLYYIPNTDHFFSKYRQKSDQLSPNFAKIQTNIIFVSLFLEKKFKYYSESGKGSVKVFVGKGCFTHLKAGPNIFQK